jgi:DNA-binding response OmpR family regulator
MEQTEAEVRSVLVVEDEPNIARVCERILAAEGFQLEIAVG